MLKALLDLLMIVVVGSIVAEALVVVGGLTVVAVIARKIFKK